MSKLYYKGENIFLYVKFDTIKEANDVKVRILHEKKNDIYEDLSWTEMFKLSNNEYYLNYKIPNVADCGLYNIIYTGKINDDLASVMETFHIIEASQKYSDAIKVYGYVNDNKLSLPIPSVYVEIKSTDGYCTQSVTKENGYWETYIYPGEYEFSFTKDTFNEYKITAQIGNENTEIQFNNIVLENKVIKNNGTGMYRITDGYITKDGIPLDGLTVKAYDVLNPTVIVAEDITDNTGYWTLFLDSGVYLLKVNGNSMNKEFSYIFRLKISDSGECNFDNISTNIANIQEPMLDRGNGSKILTDYILTKNNEPIMDVQIIAFKISNPTVPIAEDYTDATGKWELYLDPGQYIIEIYHPNFKDIKPQTMNVI